MEYIKDSIIISPEELLDSYLVGKETLLVLLHQE